MDSKFLGSCWDYPSQESKSDIIDNSMLRLRGGHQTSVNSLNRRCAKESCQILTTYVLRGPEMVRSTFYIK